MIKGFEEYTSPLNEEQKRVAYHLFNVFKHHRKFRTNKFIREELRKVFGVKVSDIELRTMMHYIRCELCTDGFVMATSKGYKYTDDLQDMIDYKISLDGRIKSQMQVWSRLYRIIGRKK